MGGRVCTHYVFFQNLSVCYLDGFLGIHWCSLTVSRNISAKRPIVKGHHAIKFLFLDVVIITA